MKRVFSSYDRVAVYHALNLLESEGIRAVVRNEFLSSAMGELPPAECQAEVWVLDDSKAGVADSILQSKTDAGPAWVCACGERCEGQFTQCWSCGALKAAAPG